MRGSMSFIGYIWNENYWQQNVSSHVFVTMKKEKNIFKTRSIDYDIKPGLHWHFYWKLKISQWTNEEMLLAFTGSERTNLTEGQTKIFNIKIRYTRSTITTKNAPFYDTESNSRWECFDQYDHRQCKLSIIQRNLMNLNDW